MHRWACPVPGAGGHYLLVDVLSVKKGRGILKKYGSQYGGIDYDEGELHTELTVDECVPLSPSL